MKPIWVVLQTHGKSKQLCDLLLKFDRFLSGSSLHSSVSWNVVESFRLSWIVESLRFDFCSGFLFVCLRFYLVNRLDEARSRNEARLQALQQELLEWKGIGRSYEVAYG